jgi:hypothetical protein
MQVIRDSYLVHSFDNRLPTSSELAVGKLAIVFFNDKPPCLYTKTITGEVIEVGKGAEYLRDLDDIDLSNAREGYLLVKQGDKYIASNFIGSLGSLTDIELTEPIVNNQYLRYNELTESYGNYYPSLYLSDLTNVEVADPSDDVASLAQANKVLYFDYPTNKFKTRNRTNAINELSDVEIAPTQDKYQILGLDPTDGIWKNTDLKVEYDPAPKLGGDLDGKGFSIVNTSYKLNRIACVFPVITLNYALGDYWVLQGAPVSVINQCIVNINIVSKINTTSILMLEIRQDTGSILLGNLINVKYEDGELLRLSGAGKTDLLTITQTNVNGLITTYVTAAALNLSEVGQGGVSAFRYDKNRYPFEQLFAVADRYDTYFDYVEMLLTFEPEVSTGKTWLEDKACRVTALGQDIPSIVTTSGTKKQTDIYNLGIQEEVLSLIKGIPSEVININTLVSNNQYIKVTTLTPILLDGTFTLELYLNYDLLKYKENSSSISDTHYMFSNEANITTDILSLSYTPFFSSISQGTKLELTIGTQSITLPNAYTYFANKTDDFYTHIAIQRNSLGVVSLFIDGILQTTNISSTAPISLSDMRVALVGNLGSIRLTKGVERYTGNSEIVPSLRFGLVGGAVDILDREVFNDYTWLDRELEHEIFCS